MKLDAIDGSPRLDGRMIGIVKSTIKKGIEKATLTRAKGVKKN